MNKKEITKEVRSLCKKEKIYEPSYKALFATIEKRGYTIIEFNSSVNDVNVLTLIEALGLSEMITKAKGFTYADSKYRLVFVNESLAESEKAIVLAHELGHIHLHHLLSAPVMGNDVEEEYEANEFAHYLMNPGLSRQFQKHWKKFIVIALALLALFIGIFSLIQYQSEKDYFGEYYITDAGTKYHKSDCIYVFDKSDVHRMSKEEYDSGLYEPCNVCKPDQGK